jgi:hypothetical protein
VYWGAQYGARRFFERAGSGWEKVAEHRPADGVVLEEVVFRRRLRGSAWNRPEGERLEQLAVLRAVHGDKIEEAVRGFWQAATEGAEVSFLDGERARSERVHVVGYAGHNRLMDGLRLPAVPEESGDALPSFVLACYSERYFSAALRKAGSEPLVTTRTCMAPEGYLIDAVLVALGENLSAFEVRRRAVAAYAKWQRLSQRQAEWIFAPRPD